MHIKKTTAFLVGFLFAGTSIAALDCGCLHASVGGQGTGMMEDKDPAHHARQGHCSGMQPEAGHSESQACCQGCVIEKTAPLPGSPHVGSMPGLSPGGDFERSGKSASGPFSFALISHTRKSEITSLTGFDRTGVSVSGPPAYLVFQSLLI